MAEIPWFGLSLTWIAISCAFDVYLSWRQLRRYQLDKNVPSKLEGLVSQKEFEASCAYQGECMKFEIFRSVFDEIISLQLLLKFVYPLIWSAIVDAVGPKAHEITASLVFLLVLALIGELQSLPFALYSDFVIEARHGFNKKTLGLFFSDVLKQFAIGIIIGGPVSAALIWIVRWAGSDCYNYLWAFSMVVVVSLMFLAPILIMPLFNKYEPVADQDLKQKIEALAATVEYPLRKLYQIDGSKRSNHSNAFMYGFWKNKRIVLFDTLFKHSHEEIIAILAHELGHWKMGHAIRMIGLISIQIYLQFWLFNQVVFRQDIFEAFGFHNTNAVVVGIFIFAKLYEPLSFVLAIASTLLSRVHEFQADEFATSLGHSAQLKKALVNVGIDNKTTYNPDAWYAWCKYSHPTLTERLEAIEMIEKKE